MPQPFLLQCVLSEQFRAQASFDQVGHDLAPMSGGDPLDPLLRDETQDAADTGRFRPWQPCTPAKRGRGRSRQHMKLHINDAHRSSLSLKRAFPTSQKWGKVTPRRG